MDTTDLMQDIMRVFIKHKIPMRETPSLLLIYLLFVNKTFKDLHVENPYKDFDKLMEAINKFLAQNVIEIDGL